MQTILIISFSVHVNLEDDLSGLDGKMEGSAGEGDTWN